MAKELSPIQIVEALFPLLPKKLLVDINGRMEDWIRSGGKSNDNYMYQQARVAENYYRFILKVDPKKIEAQQGPIINNRFAQLLAGLQYQHKCLQAYSSDVDNWKKG